MARERERREGPLVLVCPRCQRQHWFCHASGAIECVYCELPVTGFKVVKT